MKKIQSVLCGVIFSIACLSANFSHAEEIQLVNGEFFYINVPDDVEKAEFITLDSKNNNFPIIENIDVEETVIVKLSEESSMPYSLNLSANTLTFNSQGAEGLGYEVTFVNDNSVIKNISSPNIFIFSAGIEAIPVALIRLGGEVIPIENGDDPNTYIAPPEGLKVVFSKSFAPPPPENSESPGQGGIPDSGILDDNPFPDENISSDGCQLAQRHSSSPVLLWGLGFCVFLMGINLRKVFTRPREVEKIS